MEVVAIPFRRCTMRTFCLTCVTVAAALLVIAGNPATAEDTKKDKDRIQGTWKAVDGEIQGQQIPEEGIKNLALTLKLDGDKYTFDATGQNEEGKVKLDPDKKPKTIDFIIETGTDKGKTQLGIYAFEDGKLKLCVSKAGETDRPTSFKTKEGSMNVCFVLKKQ
jgi:uncharacterized protein (TIGR03067 family)